MPGCQRGGGGGGCQGASPPPGADGHQDARQERAGRGQGNFGIRPGDKGHHAHRLRRVLLRPDCPPAGCRELPLKTRPPQRPLPSPGTLPGRPAQDGDSVSSEPAGTGTAGGAATSNLLLPGLRPHQRQPGVAGIVLPQHRPAAGGAVPPDPPGHRPGGRPHRRPGPAGAHPCRPPRALRQRGGCTF